MTISTFETPVNTLSEMQFIAGSYKELYFYVYTSASVPINLINQTARWILCPFSNQEYETLSKDGVCYNGYIKFSLLSTDTENLSGKYIQRAVLNDIPGYDYPLGRGIVNIIPAIKET